MKLEEIRRLCDEATPGPWRAEYGGDMVYGREGRIATMDSIEHYRDKVAINAKFIAMARTELPKLLKVVEAVKKTEQKINEDCPGGGWNDFLADEELIKAFIALEELEKE